MTSERWQTFTKSQQMLFIGSELQRAEVWQGKDDGKFRGALERGLTLLDLSLDDPQWHDSLPMLLGLREKMAEFYINMDVQNIGVLYAAL